MSDTETLEHRYENKGGALFFRAPGRQVTVRRFPRPSKEEVSGLVPAVGDTHSDNTTEIVTNVATLSKRGARVAELVITYVKAVASRSGI